MAVPKNPRLLLLLFFSLSLPIARSDHHSPAPSPDLSPDSSSEFVPVPSPSVGFGPSPSPSIGSEPSPSPSIGSGPNPSLSIGSGPSPSPSIGFGPSPSPSVGSNLAPSTSNSYIASPDGDSHVDGPTLSNGPSPSPSYINADEDGPTVPNELSSFSSYTDADEDEQRASDTDADEDGPVVSDGLGPDADIDADVSMVPSDGPAQFNFSFPPVAAADESPAVKEICDLTDNPDLCLATVAPRLDGADHDVPIVLEVSIRTGADLARTGLSLAENAAEARPEMAAVLGDCREKYGDVVRNFKSAIEAFPRRDKGTMRSMLSAVITDIGDCEDGLARFGNESELSTVSEKLTNMTANCLAIVSLLP